MLTDKDLGFREVFKYAKDMIMNNKKYLIKMLLGYILICFVIFYYVEYICFDIRHTNYGDFEFKADLTIATYYLIGIVVCSILTILLGIYVKKLFCAYIYKEDITNKEIVKFTCGRFFLYVVVMGIIIINLYSINYFFVSGMDNLFNNLNINKSSFFGAILMIETFLFTFISLLRYEVSVNTESLLGIGSVLKIVKYKFKDFCLLSVWNIFMNAFFGILVVIGVTINLGLMNILEMDTFGDSIVSLICFMVLLSMCIWYLVFYEAFGYVKYHNMKNIFFDANKEL